MLLYQLFINSLLVLMRGSGAGCSVCNVCCGCLTHADDQTLIGLYKQPVQRMLDRFYEHSCKWCYKYSTPKSVAQVYSSSRTPVMPKFTLGGPVVPNKLVTLHMGVPLEVINDELFCAFVNKGKCSLGEVQVLSRSGRIKDPEVSSKVYWSVCIPSMLYGVEVLELSRTQMG